jgi:hypothetical protein
VPERKCNMSRPGWKQPSPPNPLFFTGFLLSAALLVACTGTVIDTPGSGRSPTGGNEPPAGAGGSTGQPGGGSGKGMTGTMLPPVVNPATGKPCETTSFTPARVWRLSDEQYSNAVNDLLGIRPPDLSTTGRDKSQFVDFAERFHIDAALTADLRTSVETVARQAVADLPKLTGCPTSQSADACADAFIDRFAGRAFRRPLQGTEKQELKAAYAAGAVDGPAEGIRQVLAAVLQAPSFLYRTELGRQERADSSGRIELAPHELASSLSFLLLHSIPDMELQAAANATGDQSILNSDVFRRQVERLLALPRVQDNLTRVMLKWVGLGDGINVDMDQATAELTPELKAGLEEEVRLFFRSLLTKGGTLADVLTSNKGFVDGRLAALYGVQAPAGTGFAEVTFPASERSGILTQAAILARYSVHRPEIFRGKYIRDELLCGEIPSPPNDPAIDMENAASANLSEREQAERRLAHPTCGGCHRFMDPIGFGLSKYDALARYRPTAGGKAVDDSGEIIEGGDADGKFANGAELARRLAGSKKVRSCITEKVFQYALGRLYEPQIDSCELSRIDAHLEQNGNRLSQLVAGVIYSSAFRYRTGGN